MKKPYQPVWRALARPAALLTIIWLLVSCGSSSGRSSLPSEPRAPTAAITALVTALPRPTATGKPATAESAPPDPTTSPAAIQPPASPTAQPTTTPATAAPATMTPTATIPGLIGPVDYPPDVNPLTGEQVADPTVLDRRPLAIKISNYPPQVRPQAGLGSADIIFEHYAERVTRFTAIFYSKDTEPVGSVRSGRLIDLEIPVMFQAAFGYSGSSGPVRQMFRESSFFDRIVSPDFAHGGYYRVENPGSAIEHTMFTSTYDLRYILGERGVDVRPEYDFGLSFHSDAPAGGTPASTIQVTYRTTTAYWQYAPGTQRYSRWTDGIAHVDANTGVQLSFRNIIVLGAHHEDTDILEDLNEGGHYSIQIQIWGEGPVSIFRDGQRYEGMWRREKPEDMLTYYDLDGNILPLAPGTSFVQVVPLGFSGLVVSAPTD